MTVCLIRRGSDYAAGSVDSAEPAAAVDEGRIVADAVGTAAAVLAAGEHPVQHLLWHLK